MTKPNITQSLVELLNNQKAEKISTLHRLKTDLEEWEIAVSALKSPVKLPIASGVSSVFDSLKNQLEAAENERERQEKLSQYESAIEGTKEALKGLEMEVKELNNKIEIEQANEYFEINIKPHYSKYEAAFIKFDDQRQAKINSIKKDLSNYRSDYDIIRRFMAGDSRVRLAQLNFGSSDYQKRFQRLENEFIPGCEKALADIQSQPLPDKLSNPEFRSWLTSRVLLNESIERLTDAYKEVLKVNRIFREQAVDFPECLEFKLYELPESIKVLEIDSKGKIVLSNKKI